jgi:dTMP kinase
MKTYKYIDPIFIAIEGLDGSGKSTMSKKVAEKIDAKLLKTPPDEFNQIRKKIDYLYRRCSEGSRLFYLSTVFYASDIVLQELQKKRSVVIDRYWMSSLVYNNSNIDDQDIIKLSRNLANPDLTIFLDVSKTKRFGRMMSRNVSITDADNLSIKHHNHLRNRYLGILKTLPIHKVLVINNDLITINDCFIKIKRAIKNVREIYNSNVCSNSSDKSMLEQMPVLSQRRVEHYRQSERRI